MTVTLAPVLAPIPPPVGEDTLVAASVAGRLLCCAVETVKTMCRDGRLAGGPAVDGTWWVTLGSIFDANLARLLPACGACDTPVNHPVTWTGPSHGLAVRMHADCAEWVDAATRHEQHAAATRNAPPLP